MPDYCAAFMASLPGTHACVIAGTGSIVCSRRGEGWAKTGGRGYLLGNPGSAFRYGQSALMQYLEHPDDASDSDKVLIEKVFGSTQEPQIVAKLYRSPSPAALLARLAPILGRDAQAGKAYAATCLAEQTTLLADQVESHLDNHIPDAEEPMVSAAGGVWNLHPIFLEALISRLHGSRRECPVKVIKSQQAPVHGAIVLAQEMA